MLLHYQHPEGFSFPRALRHLPFPYPDAAALPGSQVILLPQSPETIPIPNLCQHCCCITSVPQDSPFLGLLRHLPTAHRASLLPVCPGAFRAVVWAGIAGQALAQQLWCQAWGPAGRAALAGPSASAGTATTALDLAICRLCLPDASLPYLLWICL